MPHEGQDILLLPGVASGHHNVRVPPFAADEGGACRAEVWKGNWFRRRVILSCVSEAEEETSHEPQCVSLVCIDLICLILEINTQIQS